MPKHDWSKITERHVLRAIKEYEQNPESYPQAKSTFLVHNQTHYPAKAIRGIAYRICFGKPISSEEYTGGQETRRFFERLNIILEHRLSPAPPRPVPKPPVTVTVALDKRKQKHALQRLLQRKYGVVIAEMTFDWLRVPLLSEMDEHYRRVHDALRAYRGHERFASAGLRLPVDFHVEDLDLAIEYDEGQHFSLARKVALEQYPAGLAVGFSVSEWIRACELVKASDPTPPQRDETRAFYDTVRDFEIPRHGLALIRIRHGEVDWEAPEAEGKLDALIAAHRKRPVASVAERSPQASPLPTEEGINWRSLEVEFQRIRLNYLKWLFHFTPPMKSAIPGCGLGDAFRLFESANGRSFTLSPCGFGTVYVGGGKGSIRLPARCFSGPRTLEEETEAIRESLAGLTRLVRDEAQGFLSAGDIESTWRTLLEYWWVKLGTHEFAHDVGYVTGASEDEVCRRSVRDYVSAAMLCAVLPGDIPEHRFGVEVMEHFIRYGMTWNRFACCAFECGPIVLGRGRYVTYEEQAEARRRYFDHRDLTGVADTEKRELARESVQGLCDFLVLYDHKPISLMRTFAGFQRHRQALRALINDTQRRLNAVIAGEQLPLSPFSYVPD